MTEPKQVPKMMPEMPGLGIKLADIYYIIFRQKWLILGFLATGLVTAAIVYFAQKPLYWSEAKLLVRYVVDTKSMETVMGASVQSANVGGETVINSELEILTSMDLCEDVANIVGPEKILGAGKGSNTIAAAVAVYNGLSVENPRRSNIIKVRFVHADPVICRAVLVQLIDSYFTHHKLVHSRGTAVDDILMQQKEALIARIRQNEEELHRLRSQAGVISVEDAKKNLSEELSRLKQDVFNTEAQLEEFRTLWGILPAANEEKEAAVDRIPPEKIAEYKALVTRLDALRAREFDLLSQYTDENPLVKRAREQIADSEKRKKALEDENPKLAALHVPQPAGTPAIEARPDPIRVAALESKLKYLTNQLALVRSDITLLDNLDMQILEKNRTLEIDRKNYMLISASLEAAHVNDALNNTKNMANIQPVQSPSPPALNISKRLKTVAGAFIGLLVAGIAGAFLIELFIDHSVRRPSQFESKVQLPLFISIPKMDLNGHSGMLPLPSHLGESPEQSENPNVQGPQLKQTWAADHPLRPYIDGLRDRTLIHFEGDPHMPKLIGLTSCSQGAGVTSLAAGLAGALSETGEGNVLLLNLNFESQSVHPFYRGELTCGLADVLEAGKLPNNAVMQNLYVATAGSATEAEPQNLSKQLARVVPKLRVSDYDYIIFDLPATTPTTMTARLAGMMDLVILVVESGKDTQEAVKQASKQLSRSRARISAVLNKVKNPVPQWLHKAV